MSRGNAFLHCSSRIEFVFSQKMYPADIETTRSVATSKISCLHRGELGTGESWDMSYNGSNISIPLPLEEAMLWLQIPRKQSNMRISEASGIDLWELIVLLTESADQKARKDEALENLLPSWYLSLASDYEWQTLLFSNDNEPIALTRIHRVVPQEVAAFKCAQKLQLWWRFLLLFSQLLALLLLVRCKSLSNSYP